MPLKYIIYMYIQWPQMVSFFLICLLVCYHNIPNMDCNGTDNDRNASGLCMNNSQPVGVWNLTVLEKHGLKRESASEQYFKSVILCVFQSPPPMWCRLIALVLSIVVIIIIKKLDEVNAIHIFYIYPIFTNWLICIFKVFTKTIMNEWGFRPLLCIYNEMTLSYRYTGFEIRALAV